MILSNDKTDLETNKSKISLKNCLVTNGVYFKEFLNLCARKLLTGKSTFWNFSSISYYLVVYTHHFEHSRWEDPISHWLHHYSHFIQIIAMIFWEKHSTKSDGGAPIFCGEAQSLPAPPGYVTTTTR